MASVKVRGMRKVASRRRNPAGSRVSLSEPVFLSANLFPAMNKKLSLLAASLVLLTATACSTVDSRIAKNRAAFETWPPAVQDKVVRGEIGVGFTADQVRVALGEPDRVWTRTSADGTTEVWSYRD